MSDYKIIEYSYSVLVWELGTTKFFKQQHNDPTIVLGGNFYRQTLT